MIFLPSHLLYSAPRVSECCHPQRDFIFNCKLILISAWLHFLLTLFIVLFLEPPIRYLHRHSTLRLFCSHKTSNYYYNIRASVVVGRLNISVCHFQFLYWLGPYSNESDKSCGVFNRMFLIKSDDSRHVFKLMIENEFIESLIEHS